jgi:AP endonuclease-1
MPAPSRSSSKRKIESDEESNPEIGISQSSQISKKIRKEKSFASENSQPTNKVLPVKIVLPEKLSGTSRIVTWNVSGFAASVKKVSMLFFSRVIAYFDCRISTGLQTLPGSRESRHPHYYGNKGMPNRKYIEISGN